MARFEVLAGVVVVGHSELEVGDPPMGVAAGKFLPTTAYAGIQALIVAARESSQAHLSLAVRQIGGQPLPAQGGVRIYDYSADLGGDGLEVEVLGIPHPLYEQLFPTRAGEIQQQSLTKHSHFGN
jgi:hypothetical protein